MNRIPHTRGERRTRAAVAVLILSAVLAAGLFVDSVVRKHKRREALLESLVDYSQTLADANRFYIRVDQEETHLLGIIPAMVSHVEYFYSNELLPDETLDCVLKGNRLKQLQLANNSLSLEQVRAILNHNELEKLNLFDCNLSVDWREFLQLRSVRSLWIARVKFPATMSRDPPTDLSQLEKFGMTGQSVQLDDLAFLWQAGSSVRSLSLIDCDLSPEVMRSISTMDTLQSLNLSNSRFDSTQLSELASLSQLKILVLSQTEIDDDDAEFLQRMSSLERIYLWRCDNLTARTRNAIDSSPNLSRLKLVTFGRLSGGYRGDAVFPDIDRRD